MAVMVGLKNRFAWQKASTWGTVVDATTDDLAPAERVEFRSATERIANNELNDSAMAGIGNAGNETVTASVERILHYQGDHYMLAGAFGTAGVPVQVGTTAFYTHTLTPATSLEGIFYSLFSDMEVATYEIDSAKVQSITFTGTTGGHVKITYEFIGRDLDVAGNLTWGSATENSNATRNFVTYAHGEYRVNDQTGGALGSGDAIYPSEWSVTFSNNFESFFTSENDPNISEPVRNGFLTCSGSYTIPKLDANTHVAEMINMTTPKKASFNFTSGSYSFILYIPYMFWTGDIPVVSGPGRVPLNLNWSTEAAGSNPTGMSSTMPYIENVNQDTADPLA